QQRGRTGSRLAEDLPGRLARPLQVALGRAAPRREPDDVNTVRQGVRQTLEPGHASQDVLRLVRDASDARRVVLPGIDQPQVAQPEILERPHDVRDVDELLGLVQHHDDHPTSSRIPIRSGSWRSPCSHTHPLPPLHTSCPARRSRPGSISFTSRSKRTRPPTCARCHSGHATPSVTRNPRSIRCQAPRTVRGSGGVSPVARTRSARPSGSGTITYPTPSSPFPPPSALAR